MPTIFYSWQSDLPNNLNRGLIRRALDEAVKRIDSASVLEEAIRIDSDIAGVPGSPTIDETILEKIAACDVFVPDLSFVTTSEKRGFPNPNVLFELGYARSVLGQRQIVGVFNEAYGSLDQLPFDLRNWAWRRYHANTSQTDVERREERKKLAAVLAGALGAVLSARPSAHASAFVAMPAVGDGSAFVSPGELIFSDRSEDAKRGRNFQLVAPPRWFLRLVPTRSGTELFRHEGIELIYSHQLHNLLPFPARIGANTFGAICICVDANEMQPHEALGFVQIFQNRELWFADSTLLSARAEGGGNVFAHALQVLSIDVLIRFLAVAKDLHLKPPLRVLAGLTGVAGRSLYLRHGAIALTTPKPRVMLADVSWEGRIDDLNAEPASALRPFFDKVWDAAGLQRPANFGGV